MDEVTRAKRFYFNILFQWISTFSMDSRYFVTASGNAYAGIAQMISFDAQNGHQILNTDLSQVKNLIHGVPAGMFDVWAIDFVP